MRNIHHLHDASPIIVGTNVPTAAMLYRASKVKAATLGTLTQQLTALIPVSHL